MSDCYIDGELITSAISKKISSWFTSGSKKPTIYKEQIVQGFKKPSFFVWQLDVTQTKLMANNYRRLYQMNIRYHAEDDLPKEHEHLRKIENELLQCLSSIDVPIGIEAHGQTVKVTKPVRPTSLNSNIQNGVLQVFANYVIYARESLVKDPTMQTLQIIN